MAIKTDIETVKAINFKLGAAALVVGCLMTFEFGRSMSLLHAASLCVLTIAAAFLPAYVHHLWNDNAKPTAAILGAICVLFIGVEYFSHLGYTVGHRVRDEQETGVTNAKFDDARESLKSERANLDMWRKQLADLQAQNAWATTVTADALRAKLPGLDLAIAQEAKRGGCGPKCLERTKERDTIASQIATTETVADLKKRIEATQRVIDGKTTTAANTEFKSSKIVNQTMFVSQLATLELDPGKAAFTWSQIAIGAAIALVTTFLPAVCFFVAFRDRHSTSQAGYRRPAATSVAETMKAAGDAARAFSQRIELKDRGRVIDVIGAAPA